MKFNKLNYLGSYCSYYSYEFSKYIGLPNASPPVA